MSNDVITRSGSRVATASSGASDPMLPLIRLVNPLVQAKRIADHLEAVDISVALPPHPTSAPDVLAQLPSEETVLAAINFLQDALTKRCEPHIGRLLLGVFLDCLGRKAGENAPHLIAGLVHVITEDCTIDEEFDRDMPISKEVLGLALKRLMKDNKFIPAPSELYEACTNARASIEKLHERIQRSWEGDVGNFIWDLENRAKRQAALNAGEEWDDEFDEWSGSDDDRNYFQKPKPT